MSTPHNIIFFNYGREQPVIYLQEGTKNPYINCPKSNPASHFTISHCKKYELAANFQSKSVGISSVCKLNSHRFCHTFA